MQTILAVDDNQDDLFLLERTLARRVHVSSYSISAGGGQVVRVNY
jgi:hypothetical protein